MSLESADAIRMDWAKFLELTNGSLMMVFIAAIPQSFLPYPKEAIEEAMDVSIQQFSKNGDDKAVELCKATLPFLDNYIDDKEAIEKASNFFNNKNFLEVVLPHLGETQRKQFEYLQSKF